MIQRDVAPEHQPPVVGPQNLLHAAQVIEIDRADAALAHLLAALALAELKGLVLADVEEAARKEFVELPVPVGDKPVGLRLLRREHVAVGRFGERRVLLQT